MERYIRNIRLEETKEITNAMELSKEIENVIKKYFPKSFIKVGYPDMSKFISTMGIKKTLDISFSLGKDKSQWYMGIRDNDISSFTTELFGIDQQGNLMDKLRLNSSYNTIIVNSGYKDRINIHLKEKTGNYKVILKHLDTYFSKLKKTLQDNVDKLPEDKYKLVKGNF